MKKFNYDLTKKFIKAIKNRDYVGIILCLNLGVDIDANVFRCDENYLKNDFTKKYMVSQLTSCISAKMYVPYSYSSLYKPFAQYITTPNSNQQINALMYACKNKSYELVEFLLKNGANVNSKCSYRSSPFLFASQNGILNIVELLITHGANTVHKNSKGRDALWYALEDKHLEVALFLVNYNSDGINNYYGDHTNVLSLAAKLNDLDLISLLFDSGLDLQSTISETHIINNINDDSSISKKIKDLINSHVIKFEKESAEDMFDKVKIFITYISTLDNDQRKKHIREFKDMFSGPIQMDVAQLFELF